jgi:MobC-like protein
MAGKKVNQTDQLKHVIITRVNDEKYAELCKLLDGNPGNDMSRLIRDIIYRRPIKVFTKDKSLDTVMEELALLRSEIRAIGVNINQITRWFNTYPEPQRKFFQSKLAFDEYLLLNAKIDRLLDIISNLAKRWLQE